MSFPFALPWVRWADTSKVSGAHPMSVRRIYDHELVYVLDGRGQLQQGDTLARAEPERLFLLQPKRWHVWRHDENETLHLLGVHFDWTPQGDTLRFPIFRPADEPVEADLFREPREVPNWNLEARAFLDLRGRSSVRRALERVVEEFSRPEPDAREAAGALLAHAIVLISREARSGTDANVPPDARRRAERARALLESCESPLGIEDAARSVGWSGDHLRRTFRALWGTSPNALQTSARLRRARELLRENLPVSEVARRCGFQDASHFARVFKRESGLSPREFLALVRRV